RYEDFVNADLDNYPPDAFETHSTITIKSNRPKIYELMKRHGCKEVCNSDAHDTDSVGIFYNKLDYMPEDEKELAQVLKIGNYTCGGMENRIRERNQIMGEDRQV